MEPPPPPPPEPIAAVLLAIFYEFWIVFVRASWAVNVNTLRLYMLPETPEALLLMAVTTEVRSVEPPPPPPA